MFKRIALWLAVAVFLVLDVPLTIICFDWAFFHQPSELLDVAAPWLVIKGVGGIFVGLCAIYLAFHQDKELRRKAKLRRFAAALRTSHSNPIGDTYRHYCANNGSFEPWPS